MRVKLAIAKFLLAAISPLLSAHTSAQLAPQQVASSALHTTIAIFADDPSRIDSWDAIFAALRRNLPEAVATAPSLEADPEIIRGDAIVPGLNVDKAVVVFLHGDCTLYSRSMHFPQGKALGWVFEQKHEIQPFIHVDCTRIAQALSAQSESMSRNQRTAAMSEALARVILHEWIHIASQRTAHHLSGLGKAQFTVEDLIPSTINHTVARNYAPRVP